MATQSYTVVGRAHVQAESEDEAEAIALNSEVEWEIHAAKRKVRYLAAAALLAPSPLFVIPKLLVALTA